MKKHFVLFTILFLILSGCDDEVLVSLPDQEQKLVFYSISQTDHLWQGKLSLSQNILEPNEFNPVKNAVINLYEDDVFLETLPNKGINTDGGFYEANGAKPKPGKTYKIEASAPLFKPVSAQYTQPLPVAIDNFDVKVLGRSASFPESDNINFKVSFTDPPESNYYEIVIEGDTNVYPDIVVYSQSFGLTFTNPAYKKTVPSSYTLPAIFDDAYFNGKSVTLEFESILLRDKNNEIKRYFVYLRTLSKELYWYLKTSALQRDTRDDIFSQPVSVESNIENGFGIFGGVTQTYKVVVLPN